VSRELGIDIVSKFTTSTSEHSDQVCKAYREEWSDPTLVQECPEPNTVMQNPSFYVSATVPFELLSTLQPSAESQ